MNMLLSALALVGIGAVAGWLVGSVSVAYAVDKAARIHGLYLHLESTFPCFVRAELYKDNP